MVKECDDTILLEAFSQYAQVKDIRMIKSKTTGKLRDFAFIEFFTFQDAANVIAETKRNPLFVKGRKVHVTYSKIRHGEILNVIKGAIG